MDKITAQTSIKNLNSELFSLNPSALITLFELSIEDIGFDNGVVSDTEIKFGINTIFRFHNSINLTTNSIFWQGKEYIATSIKADGFEMGVRGSLPSPKLSMAVSDEGIPHLARLKDRIIQLGGDLVGAKVTRIRTLSKFIDAVNFLGGIPPQNFFPDPNSELPRDIYYIDRKSNENKNLLEYELTPIFDLEGIKLPGRLVTANNCTACYRGNGCYYEYNARRNNVSHENANLPDAAPPVANEFNKPINTLITGVSFVDHGLYNRNQTYNKGDFIYIEHKNIKYYFVSVLNNNSFSPPNSNGWISDSCSKNIKGCRLRWEGIGQNILPFNGFPSVNRFR